MSKRTILTAIVVAWLVPASALAQDAPADATLHPETVGERGEDDLTLTFNAGAALNYGNARNFAVNLGANFQLRRDQHAFLAEVGWIYGLQSVRDSDDVDMDGDTNDFLDWVDSSNNFTGRLRYDFFADPDNSVFVVGRVRADPFALLQPRVQAQAGWLHNLMREDKHRFWFELGADITYDNFGEPIELNATTMLTSNDRALFAARGFLGYSNEINDVLTWNSGLEVLWVFARTPQEIDPAHFRFEWINQFRSTIEDWLQLSIDITARLDSQPPGQESPWDEQGGQPTQMFDLIATLNLVGNFDLDGEPAAEPEPEPEPAAECPVCPEPEPCPECEEPPAPEPLVEEPAADEPAAEEPEAAEEGEETTEEAEPEE